MKINIIYYMILSVPLFLTKSQPPVPTPLTSQTIVVHLVFGYFTLIYSYIQGVCLPQQ